MGASTLARAGTELAREIERFLYEEAWLVDERRLHEWVDLFTDDIVYSMAVRMKVQVPGPAGLVPTPPSESLFEDDKRWLTMRVRRLETGLAHSEKPPSITRHLITNVRVDVDVEGDGVVAYSNFHVYQARLEADDMHFFGKRTDRLRKTPAGWRITRREIILDHINIPRTLTTFF